MPDDGQKGAAVCLAGTLHYSLCLVCACGVCVLATACVRTQEQQALSKHTDRQTDRQTDKQTDSQGACAARVPSTCATAHRCGFGSSRCRQLQNKGHRPLLQTAWVRIPCLHVHAHTQRHPCPSHSCCTCLMTSQSCCLVLQVMCCKTQRAISAGAAQAPNMCCKEQTTCL
jgi:hypothetical protein